MQETFLRDLSVIITARNEEFLARTVEGVIANKRGNTEVIVVCDGNWPNPPIVDHPDITMIYHSTSIGQRAAINEAARLSRAKFIMKLDAHCVVDEGFDVKLMADCEPNWTVVPRMYNLHGFDWVCDSCHNHEYQGPTPEKCLKCGGKVHREMVWKPRLHKRSDFMRFDSDLHFQYWGELERRPESKADLAETMSFVGACFFMHRKWYWDIGGSEEEWGSWGQQGTELSCKTWLMGGRVMVNKKTWFSHLFRTQGGDFGFPYPQSGKQIDHARKRSKEFFMEGKWPKAVHNLEWLIHKFAPVPGWENHPFGKGSTMMQNTSGPTKGIIYYTDNQIPFKFGHIVRREISKTGLPIVSASLKPMDFGKNIVVREKRGYLAYHKQILAALEASTADIIFFCEHDVFYHASHFDFTPPRNDIYYYNTNFWRVRGSDGYAVHYDTAQVNLICAYRELLVKHYKEKLRRIEATGFDMAMGFEPGRNSRKERIDDFKGEFFQSEFPCLDIRHGANLTASRWSQDQFRNQSSCQGWKETYLDLIPGWKMERTAFTQFSR
jgi:glycosyltransferase involved in cell wall biosynthesis